MSKRPLDAIASTSTAAAPPAKKLASIFAQAAGAPSPFKATKVGKNKTCWHGVWGEPKSSNKVLALDLDGTVIMPASGAKFPKDAADWKWWRPEVPGKIKQAYAEGYAIVILSNQAGQPAQQKKMFDKMPLIGAKLDVPFHCFAALGYDQYRKPGTGMIELFFEEYNEGVEVDVASSVYVGDAAGRPARMGVQEDHSDADRKMAFNLSMPFRTPEEYFLDQPISDNWKFKGWDPKTHDHSAPLFSPTSSPLVPCPLSEFESLQPEVVIFVGSPASGKTSLFNRYFAPAGYVHVNQDTLKTRPKCLAALRQALHSCHSAVVDNTSPARATRKEYLDLVRSEFPGTTVRILHFVADKGLCVHNSLYRAATKGETREVLPMIAFNSYWNGLEVPKASEGFDGIQTINFKFEGTEEERKRWERWHDCFALPKPKKVATGKPKAAGGKK